MNPIITYGILNGYIGANASPITGGQPQQHSRCNIERQQGSGALNSNVARALFRRWSSIFKV